MKAKQKKAYAQQGLNIRRSPTDEEEKLLRLMEEWVKVGSMNSPDEPASPQQLLDMQKIENEIMLLGYTTRRQGLSRIWNLYTFELSVYLYGYLIGKASTHNQ